MQGVVDELRSVAPLKHAMMAEHFHECLAKNARAATTISKEARAIATHASSVYQRNVAIIICLGNSTIVAARLV